MSGRRVVVWLLLALGLAAPASAQVIRASVAGELAARAGDILDVPVVVDLTGAPGRSLGGYRLRLQFDPLVLSPQAYNTQPGNFAVPTVYQDSAGRVRVAALLPAGASGVLTLFTMPFYVYSDTVVSPITLVVEELTEAGTFADLLPLTVTTSGTFCRSLGRWGDTNGDGRSDSRDALIALSRVVGLIGPIRIDTLSVNPLVTDTIRSDLADVDGDASVTSRDALIMLSNAVGLPVPGFRIGLTAAGACATGSGRTLSIHPDSLELQVGQPAQVSVSALDSAGRPVPVGPLTWRTSNPNVAAYVANPFGGEVREERVNPLEMSIVSGVIEARSPGVAYLTAEMGPGIADTLVVTVIGRRRHWYVDVAAALNAVTQLGTQALPFGTIETALRTASDGDTVHVAPGVYEEAIYEYRSVALIGDPANRPILDPRAATLSSSYALNFGNASSKATLANFILRWTGVYMEGHDNEVRRVRFEQMNPSAYGAIEVYSQTGSGGGGVPGSYGNVLIDSVEIVGLRDEGIMVDQADTVIIRNSTITGAAQSNSCFSTAIAVWEASLTIVENNTLTSVCEGIEVEHGSFVGRAVLSRNRINGVSGYGMSLRVPVLRLDHNVLRNWDTAYSYSYGSYGIHVRGYHVGGGPDSLSLLGDSIIGTSAKGILIDSARVATIDSATLDGVGLDSTGNTWAIDAIGTTSLTVANSRIRNVIMGGGIRVSSGGNLRTRRNTLSGIGYEAISAQSFARALDTMLLAGDSIRGSGGYAVEALGVRHVRIDSLKSDSTAGGLNIYNAVDTVRLYGASISGSGLEGVFLSNSRALIDSTRLTGHAVGGLVLGSNAGARATRSRFQSNGVGIRLDFGSMNTWVNRSSIAGNTNGQGARNDGTAVLNADTTYWGDPGGPSCAPAVGNCAGAGDSVLTTGVTFASHLSAADPAVPVPPATPAIYGAVRIRPELNAGVRSAEPVPAPEQQRGRSRRMRPLSETGPR